MQQIQQTGSQSGVFTPLLCCAIRSLSLCNYLVRGKGAGLQQSWCPLTLFSLFIVVTIRLAEKNKLAANRICLYQRLPYRENCEGGSRERWGKKESRSLMIQAPDEDQASLAWAFWHPSTAWAISSSALLSHGGSSASHALMGVTRSPHLMMAAPQVRPAPKAAVSR